MDPVAYYNKYAAKIYEDTVDVDMSGILEEFLSLLKEGDTILDLGCGSGRDSLAMYELGYDVTPMDASEEMCRLAEIHTGMDVLQMSFEDMEFEDVFDGIWACGSLIHVPKNEMPEILGRISDALVAGGVLYLSVKKGSFEGIRGRAVYLRVYGREPEGHGGENRPVFRGEAVGDGGRASGTPGYGLGQFAGQETVKAGGFREY